MVRFGKGIATVVAACVFLAACATSNVDQATLTPAEKRLRQQADTFNQTVVEGAVAGCAVGLLVGLLAAGNGKKGQGAAIGCAPLSQPVFFWPPVRHPMSIRPR